MIPQTIGRYEIVGLLGTGGIGQVYAARDTQLGRTVAIKALRPEYSADRGFLARFHAEAASLGNLSHPNITTLYDLLPLNGQLYMIMELVRGHTLEAVLARCKRLGLREALAVIAQTAAGLGYAHSNNVIHRDIKPSNLMLTEGGLLKIMDFGIARVRGSQRLTRAGSIVGTLFYVAPEQIKGGEGDEQSDVYSLGCVLYEMLSGDPPFRSESDYDLIKAHVESRPPPLAERIADLPAPVEQALMRALAKNPEERFATVEQFSRALGAEAIQGQAAEIIRTAVLPLAGPVISLPARISARLPDASANHPPTERTSGAGRFLGRSTDPLPRPSPGSMQNRMPVIVLTSTVAILAIGFVYFLWGADLLSNLTRQETPIADVTAGSTPDQRPPAKPIQTAQIQNTDTVPTQTAAISPTPNVATVQRNTAIFVGIGSSEQKMAQQPKQNDLVLPNRNDPVLQTAPAQTPPPSPALASASEKPAYQGRVANWTTADWLWVWGNGGDRSQPLHLYGIVSTASPAQAKRDSQQLNDFINSTGRSVTCYVRAGIEFQCFAGDQDIALWAVKRGLAGLADDAPTAYREAKAVR